jgi:nickel-dependent lactate racemase
MTSSIEAAAALPDNEAQEFVRQSLAQVDLDGRTLCLVIPDATRACPLPMLLDAVEEAVAPRVRACTAVVALGTHAPMSDAALLSMAGKRPFAVRNHEWWEATTFVTVGTLEAKEVARLSAGHLHEPLEIRINRLVTESDVTLIVGPVLPHEVVGFSGGNKYLFPGLSGPELIDATHWVGALITSHAIIGTRGTTPVRAMIDAAADLVPGEHHALCVVTDRFSEGVHALSFGDPKEAWSTASGIAAQSHIEYLPRPVQRVLSLIPTRYDDMWTGAKGFYKVEPVVADGGEVVLFAPHITEVSKMHPAVADLGYHCRDYFLAHWPTYEQVPRGELAHSTHLFGAGTYDRLRGEHQRVKVTLATGIPERTVRHINLNYLDPRSVDIEAWRRDKGALVVPDAGEVLYRPAGQ